MNNQEKKGVSRKWRFGTIAMVTTAIVVAFVILLNVVMDIVEERYPLTLDLTTEGTYSLSDESYTLARNLENETEVVVFLNETVFTAGDYTPFKSDLYAMQVQYERAFGKDVGGQYYMEFYESFTTVLDQFYNLLKTYRAESNEKLTCRFVDLDASPALAAAYQQYEPEKAQVLFLSGERHQSCSIVDFMTGGLNQSTMLMKFNSEVERIVASKINLVSSSNTKKATVLTGHGEDAKVISQLTELLPLNGCMVTTMDITTMATPDEDTDVFIIPGASTDYTVEQIGNLRTWLNNDNKLEKDLVVFTNYAAGPLANLYQFLGDEYGIEVLDAIVYEQDPGMQYSLSTRDPAIDNYATVASTDYTKTLEGKKVFAPTSNALKLHFSDKTSDSVFSKPLITSSDTALLMSMTEFRLLTQSGDKNATIESTLGEAESYPVVSAAYTTQSIYNNADQKSYTTDVMVFGSADFMHADKMNVSSAVNEDMFLSVFRGLTGLDTTLTISARSLTGQTLDFGSRTPVVVLGHLFVWVLPVIMAVSALIVFIRRRRL